MVDRRWLIVILSEAAVQAAQSKDLLFRRPTHADPSTSAAAPPSLRMTASRLSSESQPPCVFRRTPIPARLRGVAHVADVAHADFAGPETGGREVAKAVEPLHAMREVFR